MHGRLMPSKYVSMSRKMATPSPEAGREHEGHVAVASVELDSTSTELAQMGVLVAQTDLIVDLWREISFRGGRRVRVQGGMPISLLTKTSVAR